jgi:gluconate 2-dehydrogenase gamma chain
VETVSGAVRNERTQDELRCLSVGEAAVLEAIIERLIPGGRDGPGAREARVLRYIDRALAGDLAELRDVYSDNLPAIDASALAEHGRPFEELDHELQDDLLRRIEGEPFFETVRLHAIEGMFGDPRHGGNAGGAGWRLIGFPGPKGVFTSEDQRLEER